MARLPRIVIPNIPHLITQIGNRSQDVFFNENDAKSYIGHLKEQSDRFGLKIWAYVLLKNRVHLLAVPQEERSLAKSLGEAHRRYTNMINEREDWSGHLWQSRFSSFPVDESFILPAAHFIEMMPVMAGFTKSAGKFKWSSAQAHLKVQDDELCTVEPLLKRQADWSAFLEKSVNLSHSQKIMSHIRTGRPLGDERFIEELEKITGRSLQKKKPGRKPANQRVYKRRPLTRPEDRQISEQDLAALIDSV